MKITTATSTFKEIFVDGIPMGFILLDEQNRIERAEIYSDFLKTRYEAKLLTEFCEVINDRPWAEKE